MLQWLAIPQAFGDMYATVVTMEYVMANLTWRNVAKSISDDTEIMSSLVEAAQAPEKVARNPAAVYLRLMADIGDDGFSILPEPNSNQEKKTNGLGFHIGDNMRAEMDANPLRYWDKYFFKAATGETTQGSVYVDMVKATAIGGNYATASAVLKEWNGKEVKPETLQQTVTIDGQTFECSMMDAKQRGDMAGMLDGRILNMANALRRVVGMWRQITDIRKRLSDHVEVTFVYNKRDMPDSGLANVKKPILLLEKNANPESPAYGQRTGFAETFAPTVFNQLDVDKAVGATTGNKYQILKDSRKERATAKPGAGASTKDKDKEKIEGRVSSNNLLTIMSNVRVFIEQEESKRHLFNRLAAMETGDRSELIASLLEFRDWIAEIDTPDNRQIARAYSETATEKAKADLAAKQKSDAATKEAESQPTQHERNEAEAKAKAEQAEAWRKAEKARQDAELAKQSKPAGRQHAGGQQTSGRRKAG